MIKKMKHDENCECTPCKNAEREERQYAAVELKENELCIMDAEEFGHLDAFMRSDEETEPEYEWIKPDEYGTPCLAYGVFIPQYEAENTNWKEQLKEYKGYTFGTLHDEKVYLSEYIDFALYEKDETVECNTGHIPVALLLKTSLDLTEERAYGFGHTVFPLYKDMGVLSCILNRDFLLCLGGCEESFKTADILSWKEKINKETLKKIANRLY